MMQPRKSAKPDVGHGLLYFAGGYLAGVVLGAVILGAVLGCEPPPIALKSELAPQTTTMPALKPEPLGKIAAQRWTDFRMEMHSFQVEWGFLGADLVLWTDRCVHADLEYMSATRREDKARIKELDKHREELSKVGELLVLKMFNMRMHLSDVCFDMVKFEEDRPNLLLLAEEGAKK